MPSLFTAAGHRTHSYDASEFALVHCEDLVLLLILIHKGQGEYKVMPVPLPQGLLSADLTLLLYSAPAGFASLLLL